MPFAEYARGVTRFLKMAANRWQSEIRSSERIGVVQHLCSMGIESRQHGRSAGRALRGSAKSVLEYRGLGGESILMGRVEEWVDRSERLPVLLVRAEVENVGAIAVWALTKRKLGKG